MFPAPLGHFASKMQELVTRRRIPDPQHVPSGPVLPGLDPIESGGALLRLIFQLVGGHRELSTGEGLSGDGRSPVT